MGEDMPQVVAQPFGHPTVLALQELVLRQTPRAAPRRLWIAAHLQNRFLVDSHVARTHHTHSTQHTHTHTHTHSTPHATCHAVECFVGVGRLGVIEGIALVGHDVVLVVHRPDGGEYLLGQLEVVRRLLASLLLRLDSRKLVLGPCLTRVPRVSPCVSPCVRRCVCRVLSCVPLKRHEQRGP